MISTSTTEMMLPEPSKVVAYLVTGLASGEPSICFEDERGDYGDEEHTPAFQPLVLESALEAKDAEVAALKLDAQRYRWLREQSHPWGSLWLSREPLDTAIDTAMKNRKDLA